VQRLNVAPSKDALNKFRPEGCAVVTGQRSKNAVTKDAPITQFKEGFAEDTAQRSNVAPSKDALNTLKTEGCALVTGQRRECAVTKDAPISQFKGGCA